jgi:hypothetical protein
MPAEPTPVSTTRSITTAAVTATAPIQRVEPTIPPAQHAVRVHIGTIEINSAPPVVAATPAPPAAAPAAAESGGFGAFSELRNYAPWER